MTLQTDGRWKEEAPERRQVLLRLDFYLSHHIDGVHLQSCLFDAGSAPSGSAAAAADAQVAAETVRKANKEAATAVPPTGDPEGPIHTEPFGTAAQPLAPGTSGHVPDSTGVIPEGSALQQSGRRLLGSQQSPDGSPVHGAASSSLKPCSATNASTAPLQQDLASNGVNGNAAPASSLGRGAPHAATGPSMQELSPSAVPLSSDRHGGTGKNAEGGAGTQAAALPAACPPRRPLSAKQQVLASDAPACSAQPLSNPKAPESSPAARLNGGSTDKSDVSTKAAAPPSQTAAEPAGPAASSAASAKSVGLAASTSATSAAAASESGAASHAANGSNPTIFQASAQAAGGTAGTVTASAAGAAPVEETEAHPRTARPPVGRVLELRQGRAQFDRLCQVSLIPAPEHLMTCCWCCVCAWLIMEDAYRLSRSKLPG